MRSGWRAAAIAAGLASAAGWHARAELSRWVENVDTARLQAVFLRTVSLPGGPIAIRRPPKETRAELTTLIAAVPNEAELYSLRALEAEQQMDYAAAESDWKKYAEVAADKTAGRLALADFYHRRLQPNEELAALALAAREAVPASDRFLPVPEQRPWRTYERMMTLASAQAMPAEALLPQWQAWIAQYPRETALYDRFFRFGIDQKRWDIADEAIRLRQAAFPNDRDGALSLQAELARARGSKDEARRLYEQAWSADWSEATVARYFALLNETGSARRFLADARAAQAANPADPKGAVMLAQYYKQQGNAAAALQALQAFERRRESGNTAWSAADLRTLAVHYERLNHYDGAARAWHSLYLMGGASAEEGLASIAGLMLRVPEQRIGLRTGDLSLYRDIAQLDTRPGYLNGILSLLLNSQDPEVEYSGQSQEAQRYFHRARAAELVALFEQRFPQSSRREELRAQVIDAYGIHGDDAAVVAAGTKYLADFPEGGARERVALRMADAHARQNRPQQEFAVYDSLLAELAKRAEGVPLGAGGVASAGAPPGEGAAEAAGEPGADAAGQSVTERPRAAVAGKMPRSPGYARVLDRYLARLVALKRTKDAIALYRREIDRNPNDAGLYERLALFLEQNKLTAELEKTYRDAIAKFPDPTWYHKLARWYLRRKQTQQLDAVTREVSKTFAGTDLEQYFRQVVPQGAVAPALSLQFNRYAAARFPQNLTFVRNLLALYSTRPTANAVEYEALLRKHWFHAEDLRVRFFELLSRTGRLEAELDAVRASNPGVNQNKWQEAAEANPAAVRFLAEAEAWRCHFEPAAPGLQAIAGLYPADASLGRRAASVHRSLAAFDPGMLTVAIATEERLAQASPRDVQQSIRAGELHADVERFERAGPWWDRAALVQPGRPDGYLEAATVYWDYYRYDDALRVLEEGRRRTGSPNAYAYEAGAIQESRRNMDAALREYAKGSLAGAENAMQRFLALAKRPALRPAADQLTANLVSGRDPDPRAIRLRAEMLRSQNRRADLESMLLTLTSGATAPETLQALENWARIEGLDRAERAVIERQVATSSDPVDKMRLRIRLARWFEGRGDFASGAQTLDALQRENPLILGVVRAAVDYHARTKNTGRALAVLEESARKATPELRISFLLEAAQRATAAGDVAQSRRLLAELLQADPFHGRYLAAYAETFAKQNDDAGLRDFYTQKLQALRAANLPAAERNEKTAALRRGLIPVLSRLNDHAGAVDQYVEILNRYPEDASLAQEAAAYASANGQGARLQAAYTKAMADSPKDFRWPLLMARILTQFEDMPGAVIAYGRAAEIRPDRADLLSSAAALEERLLRFDDAEKRYLRVYELSYRDPAWMLKAAEMRARLGRPKEAEEALRKSLLEGRPERAWNYMSVAEKLESWGLLSAAADAAEAAMSRAGEEDAPALAGPYARILTRARKHEQALVRLSKLASPEGGLRALGQAAGQYFTPEEKVRLATLLSQQPPMRRAMVAQAAEMLDLEAKTRSDFAIANAGKPEARPQLDMLSQLQKRRGLYQELGNQLEAYWKAQPLDAEGRDAVLYEAADAFRAAGATNAELRVLTQLARSGLGEPALSRYTQQVLRQPQRFLAEAGGNNQTLAFALLHRALEQGSEQLALQGIAARGARLTPAWSRAYTGLAGLYLRSSAPEARRSFEDLLGNPLIGERIGKPFDANQRIAGEWWFYYGSRFADYLDLQKQPGVDDYLASGVEGRPASVDAFYELGEFYRERRRNAEARESYGTVLSLSPSRVAAHDGIARVAAAEGKRDEALSEWRTALRKLGEAQDSARVPASFWTDFEAVMTHAGGAGEGAALRPDANRLLEIYVRRNGSYNIEPLIKGALAMSGAAEGTRWIAALSGSAQDPPQFLTEVVGQDWVPETQKGVLYEKLLESSRSKVAQSFGQEAAVAQSALSRAQLDYAKYLLNRGDGAKAKSVLEAIGPETRETLEVELVPLEVRAAALTNSLDALLAGYGRDREKRPDWENLQRASSELREAGLAAAAARVSEFLFQGKLAEGDLSASTFLGAAEVRLQAGDPAGAVRLLRRMTLVAGAPFEGLPAATALLERFGKRAEALEFVQAWAKAEPWSGDARQRLAELQNNAAALTAVASSTETPYAIRAAAARALGRLQASASTDSAELNLLISGRALTEAEAGQPYYFESRKAAAEQASDRAVRLRLLASALTVQPGDHRVRLRLFQTAAEGRQDYRATNTFLSLLGPAWFDGSTRFNEYSSGEFLTAQGYSDEERAQVARRLGEAQQRLGSLASAETFYRTAAHLERAPAQKTSAQAAADAVQNTLAVQARNEARRPVIQQGLEQDRVVLPREVAR